MLHSISVSQRVNDILTFWFGEDKGVLLPSAEKTKLWFLATDETNNLIRKYFKKDLLHAIDGKYQEWEREPAGCLALIILLDQFSRRIYYHSAKAYGQDAEALKLCIHGVELQYDKSLALMERVFFYFPLMHSEYLINQKRAILLFKSLQLLALSETKSVFELFLKHANQHYEIIKKFGRFPDRNVFLGRDSTVEELAFLEGSDFYS